MVKKHKMEKITTGNNDIQGASKNENKLGQSPLKKKNKELTFGYVSLKNGVSWLTHFQYLSTSQPNIFMNEGWSPC
jgi:hypothetical protein